jgi:hypothetical protein
MSARTEGVIKRLPPGRDIHAQIGRRSDFAGRGVLEQRTEEEAIRFLQRVKHASRQNYIVGGLVWHTNHPLAKDDLSATYRNQPGKKQREENTRARLRSLETRLTKAAPRPGLDSIKTNLASCDSPESPNCSPDMTRKHNFTFA